ncbi:Hypothetical protein CpMEX30_0900 [Corynebacterium pseudotuberculosis]|uniref:DUF2550 family protein n=1 Tax=Corynebacterium pseudotuberculosis 258 TaxID=1168865 RepID=A0AAU8RQZ4_CORPS|nr:DUF2550 family protein [Corynebacterium pseudotuberculosis CIP 52.97]AER68914.1 Hypothetical protein Cp106_0835 [Corynebacterium pseudotuberculosis 1/06-A]AFB72192.1 DUF2550 family protein [Corynebacterium pseudotuberculosis 316]AJF93856.1 DUF2550 family protein [Corynebacterium pseudotuberculosis 258]AKS13196.1 Hypothetical protein CpE19_0857 [Corynebacterium pseudotuberculosis]QGW57189.1 DUF2550 family protein [Corynebacterium pseudotuberculosis 31]
MVVADVERMMSIVLWIILVVIVLVMLLAAWRFLVVRSEGSAVVIRRLPADTGRRWRHGSMRYRGETLEYFKLRSLFPKADLIINRQDVDYMGARELDPSEIRLLADGATVHSLKVRGVRYEIALDNAYSMGLVSWLESAPSRRLERMHHTTLQNKIGRSKRRDR